MKMKKSTPQPALSHYYLPGLHGLMDAVFHKVTIKGSGGQAEGGYIEKLKRECLLFENQEAMLLNQTIAPMVERLAQLRSISPPVACPNTSEGDTSTAAVRKAKADKKKYADQSQKYAATVEEIAAISSNIQLEIAQADSRVHDAYLKANILLAKYCKGTSFSVVQQQIPTLYPSYFTKQVSSIVNRFGITLDKEA